MALAVPHWVWASAISAVCGAALWTGGTSERQAATIYYASWIVTVLVHGSNRYATQWGVFAVDAITFLLLTLVALRSDRYWPMVMAGFALLAVVTHAGHMVDPRMGAWAYYTAAQIWGYQALAALASGAFGAWRRRRHLAAAV